MDAPIPDPYRHCEAACIHELSPGLTVAELLGSDGPHPSGSLLVSLSPHRSALLDDEHREIEGQQVMPIRLAG
ncbi:MAG: hypothetical protein KJ956_12845 [Actinobacteria bacterium]|jgi:hypothetical protein|nr:hypothetical protein [Actinomycetota bacterium]